MGWVKLEDTFTDHPKVEMAGDRAAWLYVSGLLYAYRADTDGFIPHARVPKLTGFSNPYALADKLVEVGLWEGHLDGYLIHDYLDHQQSSSDRREKREANAERLRRHRDKKRDRNEDVTALHAASKRDGNANVSVPEREGEVELPPSIPPLRGGRSRDKDARREWVRSLAAQFPSAPLDLAEGLIWQAVAAGAETVDDVRAYVQGRVAA